MELLKEIDKRIKNPSELDSLSEEILSKMEDLKGVQSLISSLKKDPLFEKIHKQVAKVESLQSELYSLEQAEHIEKLCQSLSENLGSNNERAMEIFCTLKNTAIFSTHQEEIVRTRLESAAEPISIHFSGQLRSLLKEIEWPFASRGSVLAVHPVQIDSFCKYCNWLLMLRGVDILLDILISPITERVNFHFLSDSETNRLDKPEWMFGYITNSLSLHLDFLIGKLTAFPISDLTKIQHHFIKSLCEIARERAQSDLEYITQHTPKNSDSVLAHYIDEILQFDSNILQTYSSKIPVIDVVCQDINLVNKWVEADLLFMQDEVKKIFVFSSWSIEQIVGGKFNNLRACIVLYNSMMKRYSMLSRDKERNMLVHRLQKWIFPQVVFQHEEAFNQFKHSVMHVESNVELWKELSMKFSALHQGVASYQLFIISLNLEEFSEVHLYTNQLKKRILNKFVDLVLLTVNDCINDYFRKKGWKRDNEFPFKAIITMTGIMDEVCTEELRNNVYEFTLQQTLNAVIKEIKTRKIDSFDVILREMDTLCRLFRDNGDLLDIFKDKLNITD